MNSKKLAEASAFAAKAHEGTYRKGTAEPYISHPVEAGLIAMTMTDDEDVVAAAFLHDVVEDTKYELCDIERCFGHRVAELVGYESEDKMKKLSAADSWKQRKQAFLNHLETAPLEAKIICLSDKLSNMRLSARIYAQKGDDMWLVFNQKDKREQEWYYRSIYEKMPELKHTAACQEYTALCDEVFGTQLSPAEKKHFVRFEPLAEDQDLYAGLDHYVETELVKIRDFFNEHFKAEDLPCPYVFLSDKEDKKRTFGSCSRQKLSEKMLKFLKELPESRMSECFEHILRKAIEALNADGDFPESIAEDLAEIEHNVILEGTDDDRKIFREILELIGQLKTTVSILGEYLPERHQIILYYHEVRKAVSSNPHLDFEAKLSSVLAHEYFHAMHYAARPGCFIWNGENSDGMKAGQKLELVESLADFFSVLWCLKSSHMSEQRFVSVAEGRFNSWKKHLYSAWPYAKALYYMRDNAAMQFPAVVNSQTVWAGFKHFYLVFTESIHDPFAAYRMLRWE